MQLDPAALVGALGPVEVPVTLVLGETTAALLSEQVGTVHVAMRVEQTDAVRLVPVDPGDVLHQLADLLDRYTAGLRAQADAPEEEPDAAPR